MILGYLAATCTVLGKIEMSIISYEIDSI